MGQIRTTFHARLIRRGYLRGKNSAFNDTNVPTIPVAESAYWRGVEDRLDATMSELIGIPPTPAWKRRSKFLGES